jgi:hypothetical protein
MRKSHKHENGRVKFPPVTLHSETAKAVRALKDEKQVALGVAIDIIFFEWKKFKEQGQPA